MIKGTERVAMRRTGFLLILAVLCAPSAVSAEPLTLQDQHLLEGTWAVMSSVPNGDPCDGTRQPDDDWERYEIEFLRTGGAILVTDNVDSDDRSRIDSASREGNVFHLVLSGYKDIWFTPQRGGMHVKETIGGMPTVFTEGTAYRCAAPHHERVDGIDDATALAWTHRWMGAALLVEARPGVSYSAVCSTAYGEGSRSLEFELIGPSTYGVSEWVGEKPARYWDILRSRATDHSIIFDTSSRSPTRMFTVRLEGDLDHLFVPELMAHFVRCVSTSDGEEPARYQGGG